MRDSENIFSGVNETIILWVALSLAVLFVAIVFFDSFRRKRKMDRLVRRATGQLAARAHTPPRQAGRIRSLFQSLDAEAARRQRQAARDRDREKLQ